MTKKTTAKKVLTQELKLSRIKVLTSDIKNLIVEIEKENKNTIKDLTAEQTSRIMNGFNFSGKPENFKSSLFYAIARVLTAIGYAKMPVPKNQDKTFLEDVNRVKYDSDKDALIMNFLDKDNYVKN